jgi:5-methylcytosine-specific restriction endonuclease McrA
MPLVRGCRNRYCPEYADETGWCDRHRKAPFWSSPPLPPGWPVIRAAQLAAFPWCAECGAAATEVHHIRGRDAGHGPGNLASLCSTCHATITHREAGWLSRP